jgi:hypothetical protein
MLRGIEKMPIDHQMLMAAVHIKNDRQSLGTGFVMTVKSEVPESVPYGYLVTAYHVIHQEPNVHAEIPVAYGNGELYPSISMNNWLQPLPGVDIAIAPLPNPNSRRYSGIRLESDLIPNGDLIYPHLGGRVFYLGLFAPAHRMMARSGTIGALEQMGLTEGMGDPDTGLNYIDYPIHLVDCRSYGGFSGSPCFAETAFPGLDPAEIPPEFPVPRPAPKVGMMFYSVMLCGMFIAHYSDDDPQTPASRYGVGVMLRGQEIKEALMAPEIRNRRDEEDARRRLDLENQK